VTLGASGAVVSIQLTVAVVLHVLPSPSWSSKVNVQFPVKICPVAHHSLVTNHVPSKVIVAVTSPLVKVAGS